MAATHSIESYDLRIAALVDEGLDGYVLGPVQDRFVHLSMQAPFRPRPGVALAARLHSSIDMCSW